MIAIHNPDPPVHDYLNIMYFDPLLQYAMDRGADVKYITELTQARDCTVLVDTDFLTPDNVSLLKNAGCRIVGFNVVDSSHLSQSCRDNPLDIDLIFTLTGIQKENTGNEIVIDKEFNVTREERQFMEPDQWERFHQMHREDRLLSLPYVHWERQPNVQRQSYDQRSQRVLVRGGAHFLRVVLALFLMRKDLLDINSGFPMGDFAKPQMNPKMRFCQPCADDHFRTGRYQHREPSGRERECNSPAEWGGELDLSNPGLWNNRCPASFYWLANRFEKRYGPIDRAALETLMNGQWLSQEEHLNLLGRVTFTSDLKWIHSIYAAQRFWDGALAGCINLLPGRTMQQEFFPKIEPFEHYVPFGSEGSPFISYEAASNKDHYNSISSNALALYDQWIRPTDYAINTNLLRHIFERIA